MPKAEVNLPSGAKITVEGTTEEVQQLLRIYSGDAPNPIPKNRGPRRKASGGRTSRSQPAEKTASLEPARVVNAMKESDDWDAIEKQILDKRDVLPRVLLPLYSVKAHLKEDLELTSGDVTRVTKELGTPVDTPSASRALSGQGSKYVMAGRSRVKGVPVGYKLNRRGEAYFMSILYPQSKAR